MIYAFEWIENGTQKRIQFNCLSDAIKWYETYAIPNGLFNDKN